MKPILIIGMCILLLLISGCSSSYRDCYEDCIPFCMEGKVYEPSKWDGPINKIYRAIPECKENCFNECKPK